IAWEGSTVRPLGFIADDETKALAYNAADAIVHPALADNLPNVLVESVACGTPAVAFDVGGIGDIVKPGLTGWLASAISSSGLVDAVGEALGSIDGGLDLRSSCRAHAEREYDDRLQA